MVTLNGQLLQCIAQWQLFSSTARLRGGGGDSPGPRFCHVDQTSISVHLFNIELQRCLSYCSLNLSRYKSDSFLIGGACHAADRGYSDAQNRAPSRWKSDSFKVYLRSETLQAN